MDYKINLSSHRFEFFPWCVFKYTPFASVINLGLALKSLFDVNGIQCSFNEFGTEVLFSELIKSSLFIINIKFVFSKSKGLFRLKEILKLEYN